MNKLHITLAAAALTAALAACSDRNAGWSLSGDLVDGGEHTLLIEGYNNGNWYTVDSVKTNDRGEFTYRADAPAPYPEIMRVGLDGKFIYFPVDSVDRVSIITSAADFNHKYSLDGTPQARSIKAIDSILDESVTRHGAAATVADSALKHHLFAKAFDDPSVVSVYYVINKSVDGKPLYDLTQAPDLRFYGAVAQRFAMERPDDPRAEYMAAAYKRARNNSLGIVQEISAPETALFDITRYDSRGKSHSLAEVAGKGGVTVLSFTAYNLESSPAYNVLLNKVYDKYRANGLQIYQLAFDADETSWKQTARNLPWIAVWNSTTDGNSPLVSYNVGTLPMTFIIDRNGAIAERVSDPTELVKAVAKYM